MSNYVYTNPNLDKFWVVGIANVTRMENLDFIVEVDGDAVGIHSKSEPEFSFVYESSQPINQDNVIASSNNTFINIIYQDIDIDKNLFVHCSLMEPYNTNFDYYSNQVISVKGYNGIWHTRFYAYPKTRESLSLHPVYSQESLLGNPGVGYPSGIKSGSAPATANPLARTPTGGRYYYIGDSIYSEVL